MRMRWSCLTALVMFLLSCNAAFAAQSQASSPDSSSKISSVPASVPTNVADDEAFAGYQRVMTGITPPQAKHSPNPKYPELPPDAETKGVVVMLVGVNAQGRVEPVHVLRSTGPAFQKAAVDTVKKWKFRPAKKDGQPVPVQITVEMNFQR